MSTKRKPKAKSAERKDMPLSLAHLNDSIGYELPHALKHAKDSVTADPALRRRNVEHTVGHIKSAMEHNKKLTRKLMMIPTVKKLMVELRKDSKAAGGQ